MNINNILRILNPRLVCVVSILLLLYYFYNAAYTEVRVSSSAPYSFLVLFVFVGNLVGLYLIENHEEKWQLFSGYFVLYTFFIVAISSIFI